MGTVLIHEAFWWVFFSLFKLERASEMVEGFRISTIKIFTEVIYTKDFRMLAIIIFTVIISTVVRISARFSVIISTAVRISARFSVIFFSEIQ
jgi:hypothetical protein